MIKLLVIGALIFGFYKLVQKDLLPPEEKNGNTDQYIDYEEVD